MSPKTYSDLFFQFPAPQRSFLSLDTADSIHEPRPTRTHRARPVLNVNTHNSSRASSSSSHHRPIPNPKPAPKATLPAVPNSAPPTRPRYPAPVLPTRPRTTPSKPKQQQQQPQPQPPSRDKPTHRPAPLPRPASTATSTASTNYRVLRRTDALARLEGRTPPPTHDVEPPYLATPRANTHAPKSADVASRPKPAPLPIHRTKSAAPIMAKPSLPIVTAKSAGPLMATKSFMPFSDTDDDDDDDDEEEDEEYSVYDDSEVKSSGDVKAQLVVSRKGRPRRATIDSWFAGPPSPASFMGPPSPALTVDSALEYVPKSAGTLSVSTHDGSVLSYSSKTSVSKGAAGSVLSNFMDFAEDHDHVEDHRIDLDFSDSDRIDDLDLEFAEKLDLEDLTRNRSRARTHNRVDLDFSDRADLSASFADELELELGVNVTYKDEGWEEMKARWIRI